MYDKNYQMQYLTSAGGSGDTFFELFLIGTISGWNSELFTYPLDLTKTRLQVRQTDASGKRAGLLGETFHMVRNDGFFSLYNGLGSMLVRCMFFNSLRLVYYDLLRQQLNKPNAAGGAHTTSMPTAIVCAGVSGGLSQAACSPLDKVKIRLQVGSAGAEPAPYRLKTIHALKGIYKHAGIAGLYRGNMSSILRAVLVTTGDTAGYDISKRKIMAITDLPDNRFLQFIAAMSAGALASGLASPADVIKSRLMNQPTDAQGRGIEYTNIRDCLTKVVQKEGVMALYKGFIPLWMRTGPWTIVFWCTAEKIRQLMGKDTF